MDQEELAHSAKIAQVQNLNILQRSKYTQKFEYNET